MVSNWLSRTLAVVLAAALMLPAIGVGKAGAETSSVTETLGVDQDKSEALGVEYPTGDPSVSSYNYVGYYRDLSGDYGSSRTVLRFPLGANPTDDPIPGLGTRPEGATVKLARLIFDKPFIGSNVMYVKLYGASDNTWEENKVGFPASDGLILIEQTGPIDPAAVQITFDVTDFVNDAWTTNAASAASFVLTGTMKDDFDSDPDKVDGMIGICDADVPDCQGQPAKLEVTYVINNPPSDLTLSGSSIAENEPAGTVVGTLSATDADGDTLTYTITGGDTTKFQIVGDELQTADSFDYEAEDEDSYELTITASDPAGSSVSKDFTISVTDVNEAPADIRLTNASIAENKPVSTAIGQLEAIDDPDQTKGSYTFSLEEGLDGASFKLVGTELQSTVSFDYETKNQYQVNVKVTDIGVSEGVKDDSAPFTKTLTISVANVNEAPTGVSLSKSDIDEGLPVGTEVGQLTGADPDASDTLTYSVEGTDKAVFKIEGNSLQSNQIFNYNTQSSYSIRIKVTDAGGLAYTTDPLEISVNDVNDKPTNITLTGTSIAENADVGTTIGTLGAVDPDESKPYTYEITDVDGGGAGRFAIDGSLLKTAATFDYETPPTTYNVEIQVTDAGGAKFQKTFAINVTNVNEKPTGLSLSGTTVDENEEAGAIVGTLSAVDPDAGDSFAYEITGGADASSFGISGDKLVSKETFDFETAKASYEVKVSAKDKGNLTYEKTFAITVENVNEAPTAISLAGDEVDENEAAGTVVGTLSASDPDAGETFTYSIDDASGTLPFAITGDTLETTGVLDYETKSSYNVPVKVTDHGNIAYNKTFIITVHNIGEAPTDITLSPSAIDEGKPAGTTVGTLSATDPDAGETFQYAIVGTNDNFEIDGNVLKTTAVFDQEANSSYTIEIKVTDSDNLSYSETITVTVGDVNESPTGLTLSSSDIDENQPAGTAIGTLTAIDPDAGDTFTYAIDDASATLPFTITGDTLKTTSVLDYETKSSYNVPVKVTDHGNNTYSKTLVINVQDVNEAPTDIMLSSASVAEGQPSGTKIGTLSVTDQDSGGMYSYAIEGLDAGYFSISGSDLLTNAEFDYEIKKLYSISVRVTDGTESYAKTLTISVTDMNDAPTALALSNLAIDENQPAAAVIGTLTGTDPDAGDSFVYSIAGGADAASFAIAGNTLRTAASFDYESKQSYDVEVQATDNGGLTIVQSFTITVNDANDAPTAISVDHDAIAENQSAGTTIGTLSAADQDAGDSFTYEIAGGADASSLAIEGAVLKSAVAFDYETKSALSVTIKVTDAAGASFSQTLSLAVQNVNEAPAAASQSIETRGNRPIEGQLAASDPEQDGLTYMIVDQPAKGDLTLDAATGKFTFKPQAGNYEELTFTFKANDGRLDSNVATVTVTNRRPAGGGNEVPPPKQPDISVGGLGDGSVVASFDEQDPGRLHVSFDRSSLQNLPADMKTLTLHLNDQLEGVDIAIDPWLFDQLRDRDIVLSVETSLGVLSLPKSAWALADGDTLTVTLESAPSAQSDGLHVIGKPVSIQLEKGGVPIAAPLEEGFLNLKLSASGNAPTTAVRLLGSGEYRPVPSLIAQADGGYSVEVSSRSGGTFVLVSESTPFSDTSGWARPYIEELASRLIVNGVGEGKFEPNRGVTRAEFAKILVQALDLSSATPAAGFKDTDSAAWYADAVGTAVDQGLFSGYPDGTFHPSQTISRQEAFAVLSRALKLAGLNASFTDQEREQALDGYADAANVQDWAQEALAISQILGLVHDEGGEFRPSAPMTREQLCYSVVQLLRGGGLIEQD
ncbi:cadherin domain-containing protein [Cohnella lubricantis]|uniref:Cadherin domain-containing protein n=1 Tax=Cohnella lubricantis TaxID=2163172 RepID=A0A841TI91_9BACL|nr:cadherin domain-containing protein [Cohnella lubricantis]MBB6678191.1 cadherin domain-containing protein [Cohnella lubricantis]MBP2119682.1 hypothetical protein [Cohnella lubricantis]